MTFNEGTWDRAIRVLVGLVFAYAAWAVCPGAAEFVSRAGIPSMIFSLIALDGLVTGAIGWSPLYALFGWSTKEKVGA
jgi:hypothetical protein